MSTVVVVRKDKQIAIAADSLTTYGHMKKGAKYLVNHSKIFKLGNTYVAACGCASWDSVLISYYRSLKEKPSLDSIQAIYEFVRLMHPVLREEYYLHTEADKDDDFEPTNTTLVMANAAGVFSVDRYRTVQEYFRYYAFGSGEEFALGAMFALYDKKLSAREIAKAGVAAGCEFDDGSEGPIEVRTISLA